MQTSFTLKHLGQSTNCNNPKKIFLIRRKVYYAWFVDNLHTISQNRCRHTLSYSKRGKGNSKARVSQMPENPKLPSLFKKTIFLFLISKICEWLLIVLVGNGGSIYFLPEKGQFCLSCWLAALFSICDLQVFVILGVFIVTKCISFPLGIDILCDLILGCIYSILLLAKTRITNKLAAWKILYVSGCRQRARIVHFLGNL